MKLMKTGLDQKVLATVLRYRMFLPYGCIAAKSSYAVLLNFGKKVLINTGVIENSDDIRNLLKRANLTIQDLDMVINMTPMPEHTGLNAVIQNQNPDAAFYAHPDDLPSIENTVLEREKNYIPGFYKLVAGNTENVKELYDGQKIYLDGETIKVSFHREEGKPEDGRFALLLEKSGIVIESREIRKIDENKAASEELFLNAMLLAG